MGLEGSGLRSAGGGTGERSCGDGFVFFFFHLYDRQSLKDLQDQFFRLCENETYEFTHHQPQTCTRTPQSSKTSQFKYTELNFSLLPTLNHKQVTVSKSDV